MTRPARPDDDKGSGFVPYRHPHSTAVDAVTGEQYDDLLVINEAWLAVAPKRLSKDFLADG